MSCIPSPSDDRLSNQIANLEHRLGPIEYRSLASLKRYEGNPRTHPEKQLLKLAASIREFGFAMPILVDEANTIIAGEARLEAARRAGIAEIPVIVAHHWSRTQIRAYRLADNKLADLATWDESLLASELAAIIEIDEGEIEALGWETAEIEIILEDGKEHFDEGPVDAADDQWETPCNPISRTGDLWVLGKHRLVCGTSLDARNWQRLLEGEMAAMVFSSPSYDVNYTGLRDYLEMGPDAERAVGLGVGKGELAGLFFESISSMLPYCKDGAILDLCIDWQHLGDMIAAIEGNGLSLLNLCVWKKNREDPGSLYRNKHEHVFIARKGSAPHSNKVETGRHGRSRTDVWDYPDESNFGNSRTRHLAEHATVKPTALVADAIEDVTHPGEIVIDGFVGVGTTILACERTGRRGYGIEIEPRFVDLAIRRWEKMVGTEAVLAATGQPASAVAEARSARYPEHGEKSRVPGEKRRA